jgi:arylsulfatase B
MQLFSRNYSRGYDMRRDLEVDRSYDDVYITDVITSEAVSVIENHDGEKPLFLLVNQQAPHAANNDDPMQAKQEDIEKFPYIENENRTILAGNMSLAF